MQSRLGALSLYGPEAGPAAYWAVDTTDGKTAPRLIAIAAGLVGEAQKVREAMQCSPADFLKYCDGTKELPLQELDRLLSLIIREQGLIIAKNREMLSQLRAKQGK